MALNLPHAPNGLCWFDVRTASEGFSFLHLIILRCFNPAHVHALSTATLGSTCARRIYMPIELQIKSAEGKRSGHHTASGIGELTWPQTVTLLDLLVNLFWTGTSFDERWRFSPNSLTTFPPIEGAEMSPYHSRYGGLCMLSWLLSDWDTADAAQQVARVLLSRWLAGSQPQASRFAGIRGDVESPRCARSGTRRRPHFRSILVAACGGDAHSAFFPRSPFFYP